MVHDLTGVRFGRLIAVEVARRGKSIYWKCLCDCGAETVTRSDRLRIGHTRSCGCLRVEVGGKAQATHRKTKTREFKIWIGIIDRCCNPFSRDYRRYGAKGIGVCERWKGSFEAFIEDMGWSPAKCSVDRIDNAKGYSPDNCRWATAKEQGRNRSDNKFVEWNGERRCIADWAERIGISPPALQNRLRREWPIHLALTLPASPNRRVKKVAEC